MHQLLVLLVCLATVDLVVSKITIDIDLLKPLNVSKPLIDFSRPFGGIFDDMFSVRKVQSPPSSNDNIDISKLHNAINAKNPNEDAIINILAPTNVDDRNKIRTGYQRTYGISLVNDLKDKLTGKFEEAVVALMTPLKYYYAQEIHDSIYGVSADEKALIDTLCIFNNSYLDTVRNAYFQLYGQAIQNELSVNTLGNFKKLMDQCVKEYKVYHLYTLDDDIDDNDVIYFMSLSNFRNIYQFAMGYHKRTGKYLENTIIDKFSGDFQKALLHIVYYAKGEKLFLAKRLHESLEGKEVDYRSLIRLAIMDKTIHPSEVRDFYEKYYKKSLDSVITNKIPSGSYRKLIQALLNK